MNKVVKKIFKGFKFKITKPITPVKKDIPIPMNKPDSSGRIKSSQIKKNIKSGNVNGS